MLACLQPPSSSYLPLAIFSAPYPPALHADFHDIFDHGISRGGIIRSSWQPSKIWMGTRCFWCLLTGPAADRHLPSRNLFCQFNVTSAYNHASEDRQSISRADLHGESCAFRCRLSSVFDVATWDRNRQLSRRQNIFSRSEIWISKRRLKWTSNVSMALIEVLHFDESYIHITAKWD